MGYLSFQFKSGSARIVLFSCTSNLLLIVASSPQSTLIFYLLVTLIVTLTKCSAGSLCISKVCFWVLFSDNTVTQLFKYWGNCFPVTAHSAFDFEEFAACLRQAYSECKIVEELEKFTNFTATISVMNILNTASTTAGADHFN